jgi:hypothetical protein
VQKPQNSSSCFSSSFVGVLMYDLTRLRYSSWSIFVRAYPTMRMFLGRKLFRCFERGQFGCIQLHQKNVQDQRVLGTILRLAMALMFSRCSSTYSLLLCQVTRGAQDYDDGVVLELFVTIWTRKSAMVPLLLRYCALDISQSYPSITRHELSQRIKVPETRTSLWTTPEAAGVYASMENMLPTQRWSPHAEAE